MGRGAEKLRIKTSQRSQSYDQGFWNNFSDRGLLAAVIRSIAVCQPSHPQFYTYFCPGIFN